MVKIFSILSAQDFFESYILYVELYLKRTQYQFKVQLTLFYLSQIFVL